MNRKVMLLATLFSELVLFIFLRGPVATFLGIKNLSTDKSISDYAYYLLYAACWYVIPVFLILSRFYKPKNIFSELGLAGYFLRGWLLALIITFPMLIGGIFFGTINHDTPLWASFVLSFYAGIFEEFFFRGFLFGQLFNRVGFGFIPAAAVSGFVFGAGHLYQAHDLWQSLSVFGVTFLGSLWFAWLFIENERLLWLPMGVHSLMDFYFSVFGMGTDAIGNIFLNTLRILTFILSIYITVRIAKKRGTFLINRKNFY